MAIPSWIDAKQLVIPSALIAADCPRVADLALRMLGMRRLCALAMLRRVTWAWQRFACLCAMQAQLWAIQRPRGY